MTFFEEMVTTEEVLKDLRGRIEQLCNAGDDASLRVATNLVATFRATEQHLADMRQVRNHKTRADVKRAVRS